MSTRELQLQGDLRQAIENYFGEMVGGPWDTVIDTIAGMIQEGECDLQSASRLDLALRRTANTEGDECPTCENPILQPRR